MLAGGSRTMCTTWRLVPGLDLYLTDPAQPLVTARWDLDDVDRDLYDLSDMCTTVDMSTLVADR